jgi:hypothetical protein
VCGREMILLVALSVPWSLVAVVALAGFVVRRKSASFYDYMVSWSLDEITVESDETGDSFELEAPV